MFVFQTPGLCTADILIPASAVDLQKWAVVACDQYAAQPAYWQKVAAYVGDAPSMLHCILPECYLTPEQIPPRVAHIVQHLDTYLKDGTLQSLGHGVMFVRRRVPQGIREGLVLAVDLEAYNYSPDSQTPIRATEGTILSRIPPRMEIRKGAAAEAPHIMLLFDDPQDDVMSAARQGVLGPACQCPGAPTAPIGPASADEDAASATVQIAPCSACENATSPTYQTELMMDSGSIEGFFIQDKSLLARLDAALLGVIGPGESPMPFAVGDGNHSLATAKACWEEIKKGLTPQAQATHPARHCLVELVNIHSPALTFEPIHRVVFGVSAETLVRALGESCRQTVAQGPEEMCQPASAESCQPTLLLTPLAPGAAPAVPLNGWHMVGDGLLEITLARTGDTSRPAGVPFGRGEGSRTPAFDDVAPPDEESLLDSRHAAHPDDAPRLGVLQSLLDAAIAQFPDAEVEYVHGRQDLLDICRERNAVGFLLPTLPKSTLFEAVRRDGPLPRKTFSLGEADDKRFYLELRQLM